MLDIHYESRAFNGLHRYCVNPLQFLRRQGKDQNGAVTVDFLVITAVIVVMGTVIVGMTRGGTVKIASEIGTELEAVPVTP